MKGFGIENYKRRTDKEKVSSANRLKKYLKKYLSQKDFSKIEKIIKDHFERFTSAQGSAGKHQPWEGGYFDHLQQTFEYAIRNFDSQVIKLLPKHEQYKLSDVLLVLFFHDLEKPFKYYKDKKEMENEYGYLKDGKYFPSDKEKFAEKYVIKFLDIHRIALHYVHGENHKNYHPIVRRQSPLGAAAGNADRFSARAMFNMGYDKNGRLIKYLGPNLEGKNVGTLKDII